MNLDTNNHSVFLLYYHLVLVVKYRRQVFDDVMSEFAKNIFVHIATTYNITLEQWNKSASSRLIKKNFPAVRRKLWKEMFWSRSFCLLTSGGAPIEVIRKYIQTQGQDI